MSVDAIVLAGSSSGERLARLTRSRTKAALRLFGRPMLEYVLEALLEASSIRSVVVVGAPNLVTLSTRVRHEVTWVPGGEGLSDSLRAGLEAVSRIHAGRDGKSAPDAGTPAPRPSHVLVVACDAPLLTAKVVDAFLAMCGDAEEDVIYPLVPRKVIKESLRGVRRTYLRLSDGVFTGGNLALVRPPFTEGQYALLEKASRRRKNPTTMATLLGWGSFFGMLSGRLSLAELERKAADLLALKVKGLVVPHAEVGFDVDGPLDYLVALNALVQYVGVVKAPTRPT